jgi:hypothetical protein
MAEEKTVTVVAGKLETAAIVVHRKPTATLAMSSVLTPIDGVVPRIVIPSGSGPELSIGPLVLAGTHETAKVVVLQQQSPKTGLANDGREVSFGNIDTIVEHIMGLRALR